MKVDPIAGITPLSLASVEQTVRERAELTDDRDGAREVAGIAHRSSADLVAVVEHAGADPALLFGVLVTTTAPLGVTDMTDLCAYVTDNASADIREVVHGRSRRGYPVVLAERVVTADQLRVGVPFDCQLQAVVADPVRPQVVVFTLTSPTGRGWLDLSDVFGRLIRSVDFDA